MRWLAQRAALGAALFAALALGGCATEVGPSTAELKASWEAQNIVPDSYKRDLMAFMRTYLNDPSHVRDAAVAQPVRKEVGPGERYVVCVRYNERKSDGKYAGVKDGMATFVSGKLDRFFDVPREVRPYCKDAVYAPFPELQTLTR
jgi:hypothetical protein